MSRHRDHQVDNRSAERLPRGAPVAGRLAPLSGLDVAAAAPAPHGELTGEQVAAGVLRAARLGPASEPQRSAGFGCTGTERGTTTGSTQFGTRRSRRSCTRPLLPRLIDQRLEIV